MEIKNGIIIDGVLHEAVQDDVVCDYCSLLHVCKKYNVLCRVLGCESFTNRGKVTDIKTEEEKE